MSPISAWSQADPGLARELLGPPCAPGRSGAEEVVVAHLSSVPPPRRSARGSASPRLCAKDPIGIVACLAADCWAASEVVATDRALVHDAEILRQSARELALLADVCGGGGAIAVKGSAPRPAAKALRFVIASYRAALEAPLPRAVREVLRAQLERLVQADHQKHAA